MTTTLLCERKVILPEEILERLGLPEGAVFSCTIENGRIILDPNVGVRNAHIEEKNGRPVLVAPPGAPKLMPELVRDISSI